MSAIPHTAEYQAWVVFTDKTELPILKFLSRGFRHCFLILHTGKQWMQIEPLSTRMHVDVFDHLDEDFDIPAFVESRGDTIVPAKIDRSAKKVSLISLLTCVSATKRILGIHNPFILTPKQLHKHLTKES